MNQYKVNTNKLLGMMKEQGYTIKSLNDKINDLNGTKQSYATLQRHFKNRVFGTDEVAAMVNILKIDNPSIVFFPSSFFLHQK